MARTTKRGTCELCGASANVGMNHGAKVCPQCTHVQSALNKRIESVAAAARSMGKTEELLGHLIPAGGGIAVKVTADLLQEISGIVGYEGEDPGELVAAVRRRVLARCASCGQRCTLSENGLCDTCTGSTRETQTWAPAFPSALSGGEKEPDPDASSYGSRPTIESAGSARFYGGSRDTW